MHNVDIQEMSEKFLACWKAAGTHLNSQVEGGIQSWLKAEPGPPYLEHLSFRLGNQLFFIRVEDVAGKVIGPGNQRGLMAAAENCHGHACHLPMKKKFFGGGWVPAKDGWGLVDAKTGRPVDPPALVTNEKIEMTPWERQDMAVQVVREDLKKQGCHVISWQGNPEVDPSIWFVGKSQKPEWIVVRVAKYPANQAERPTNWDEITARCAQKSKIGHFASVALVSADQASSSDNEAAVPLFRGQAVNVGYTGLS